MSETINIMSAQNKYIKQINLLKTKKERDKTKLFIAEGERLIDEIPLDWETKYIITSKSYFSSIDKKMILNKFQKSDIFTITDELFRKISDTVTPQGILAVCKQKIFEKNIPISSFSSRTVPYWLCIYKIT